MFRNHGVTREPAQFIDPEAGLENAQANPWYYEMTALGHNYRLSDINCALAKNQLGKIEHFGATRRRLAAALRRAARRFRAVAAADHAQRALRPGLASLQRADRFRCRRHEPRPAYARARRARHPHPGALHPGAPPPLLPRALRHARAAGRRSLLSPYPVLAAFRRHGRRRCRLRHRNSWSTLLGFSAGAARRRAP